MSGEMELVARVRLPLPRARLANPRPSPIRVISEGAPPGAIPLGLGEPTWLPPLPDPDFFRRGRALSYGPNAGLASLRERVAEVHGTSAERVLISCGAQAALYALFTAFLEPGDQVLVPDPGFPGYRMIAEQLGVEVVAYGLGPAPGFELEAGPLLETLARSPRARLVVLNHPSNPTGALARPGAVSACLREAERRGVLVVSDEVYRGFLPGERAMVAEEEEQSGNLVRVGSMSKAWAGAGLRVGWLLGEPELLNSVRAVHAAMVTAAPSNNQELAEWLLSESERVRADGRGELETRRELLRTCCAREWGWEPRLAPTGFYLWLGLPDGLDDDMKLCLEARDRLGVVLVPGRVFGAAGRGYVRLSFAAPPDLLAEGIRRLRPVWGLK